MLDEAAGVDRFVGRFTASLEPLVEQDVLSDFELVLVDDGSTDGTWTEIRRHMDASRRVRGVRHGHNRGVGTAIRSGIDAARLDLLLYTDADLPADPSVTAEALRLGLPGPTMVCAYRSSRRGDGFHRVVYSAVYNPLVRVVLGVRVRDVNFAFKLLPTEVAQSLGLRSEGPFIDAELVARAQRTGLPVAQFAITYRPRQTGQSTMSGLGVVFDILREMRALAADIRRQP
jgi:glycosyltransferase involved in cell wall biosynthesis